MVSTSAATDELLRQHQAEMLRQALDFPEIYRRYEHYRTRTSTADGMRAAAEAALAELLRHATRTVPFYREEVGPLSAGSPLEVLASLPLVNRRDLGERMSHYIADTLDPTLCRSIRSSGTSGVPVRLLVDRDDLLTRYALALRRQQRYGLGLQRKVLRPFRPAFGGWYEYTSPAAGLARIAEFGPASRPEELSELAERVRYFAPDAIFARPSRCQQLIELLSGTSLRPRVRAVLTLGENLAPGVRTELTAFFDAPVFDSYGMREVSEIATECGNGVYHVESDRLVVEIVDGSGRRLDAGSMGEIVVTNLLSRSMPLLRYRTGDAGMLQARDCGCGSTGPVLDRIGGRDHMRIQLPGGGVEAFRVSWILRSYPLDRFQIVQSPSLALTIIIRPAASFTAGHRAEMLRRCEDELLHAIPVVVVDAADQAFVSTPSGKAVEFLALDHDRPTPSAERDLPNGTTAECDQHAPP